MPTTAKFGRRKCADAGSSPLDAGHRGPPMTSNPNGKNADENDDRRIVTDGGHNAPDALSHLPTVPATEPMRDWVRGFAEDLQLTVDDVRAGLRWADHALVVRSVSDSATCWYYLDGHGELQLFSAEPAGHEVIPARQLHAELHDDEVVLAVELAADAPEPVQPGKETVTDGGRDTPDRTVPDNGGVPLDIEGQREQVIRPTTPPQFEPETEPDVRLPPRPQVTRDGSDDHPTVTACMDCLDYFPHASDDWERCPKCGSGLVDVEPAGDAV